MLAYRRTPRSVTGVTHFDTVSPRLLQFPTGRVLAVHLAASRTLAPVCLMATMFGDALSQAHYKPSRNIVTAALEEVRTNSRYHRKHKTTDCLCLLRTGQFNQISRLRATADVLVSNPTTFHRRTTSNVASCLICFGCTGKCCSQHRQHNREQASCLPLQARN